jgi:hypothetical protein
VCCKIKQGSRRIALIAPTTSAARDVLIEGESGIPRRPRQRHGRPVYEPSKRRLTWATARSQPRSRPRSPTWPATRRGPCRRISGVGHEYCVLELAKLLEQPSAVRCRQGRKPSPRSALRASNWWKLRARFPHVRAAVRPGLYFTPRPISSHHFVEDHKMTIVYPPRPTPTPAPQKCLASH